LSKYALIIKRPASSAVEVHGLIHLSIRRYLQEQDLLDQWNLKAISHLAENFPSKSHENKSKWRRLILHAKYALAYSVEQEDKSIVLLKWRYVLALDVDRRYDMAEKPEV
jgi:hypothetical protein